MKRLAVWGTTLALGAASGAIVLVGSASAATCQGSVTITTRYGQQTLSVAQMHGTVGQGQTVDATGCDIGVYDPKSVTGGTVTGAKYYGIYVDSGSNIPVTGATVTNTGDSPFSGAQHGVAIEFSGYAGGAPTGTISDNTVSLYQKAGIVVAGSHVDVAVTGNTVTGNGPVKYTAQNGIDVEDGAMTSALSGNTVTGNIYTQGAAKGYVATGILLYNAAGVSNNTAGLIARSNDIYGNQANVYVVG